MKGSGKRLSMSNSETSQNCVYACAHVCFTFCYGHGWREACATECKWESWLSSTVSVPDMTKVIKLGHKSAPSILRVLYFCMRLFVPIYKAHLSSLPPEPSTAASSCPTYSLKASGGGTIVLLLLSFWAWPLQCTLAELIEHLQLCLEDCVMDSTDHMPWWLCEVWFLCVLVSSQGRGMDSISRWRAVSAYPSFLTLRNGN